MSILFNKNISLIILMVILFVSVSDGRQLKDDKICNIRNVLSVKDVLISIANAADNIERKANEIEEYIRNDIKINVTLNNAINSTMRSIRRPLPSEQYHVRSFELSNIDKNDFGKLLLEAYYATCFFYNSICHILSNKIDGARKIDSLLERIKIKLQDEIICQYRNILYVYSYKWSTINQIGGIEFSEIKHRIEPSLAHDAHSIVITRLLREWMQRIQSAISNVLRGQFI